MLDKEQILWFCKEKESPKHKKKRPDGRSLMTRKVISPSLSCSPVEQEVVRRVHDGVEGVSEPHHPCQIGKQADNGE